MTMCQPEQLPEQELTSGAEAAPDNSESREPSASSEAEGSRRNEQREVEPPMDRTELYLRGPTAFCA